MKAKKSKVVLYLKKAVSTSRVKLLLWKESISTIP
ncbi:hypothetical protein GGR21_002753 [Dysgonomonas hofstadii]|uniref:Uncharacterized protein n=1 Tax=Dysgonomonas hofstadii TaxID=637886 RepID=A0A840CLH3_9BACT|nr:hypothetical protein [Dysgonomonas hofstadii]